MRQERSSLTEPCSMDNGAAGHACTAATTQSDRCWLQQQQRTQAKSRQQQRQSTCSLTRLVDAHACTQAGSGGVQFSQWTFGSLAAAAAAPPPPAAAASADKWSHPSAAALQLDAPNAIVATTTS